MQTSKTGDEDTAWLCPWDTGAKCFSSNVSGRDAAPLSTHPQAVQNSSQENESKALLLVELRDRRSTPLPHKLHTLNPRRRRALPLLGDVVPPAHSHGRPLRYEPRGRGFPRRPPSLARPAPGRGRRRPGGTRRWPGRGPAGRPGLPQPCSRPRGLPVLPGVVLIKGAGGNKSSGEGSEAIAGCKRHSGGRAAWGGGEVVAASDVAGVTGSRGADVPPMVLGVGSVLFSSGCPH